MSSQNNNAPDLNAILRTLSAFSNQTSTHSNQPPSNNYDANDHGGEYETLDAYSQSVTQSQIQSQTLRYPPPSSSSHRDSPQLNQSTKPQQPQFKDKDTSSTITTWPAALKQVMRTVGQNEEIQRRIRFLIKRQHDHEKQWWKGREALLQKQTSRKEKKRELDQVLRSVGAPVDEKEVSTAEQDLTEVSTYDAKVHKASAQMADAMLSELKALDVPFFSINRVLVVTDETVKNEQEIGHLAGAGGSLEAPEKQGRLSVDELSAFRRRMLELLQDLCKE